MGNLFAWTIDEVRGSGGKRGSPISETTRDTLNLLLKKKRITKKFTIGKNIMMHIIVIVYRSFKSVNLQA